MIGSSRKLDLGQAMLSPSDPVLLWIVGDPYRIAEYSAVLLERFDSLFQSPNPGVRLSALEGFSCFSHHLDHLVSEGFVIELSRNARQTLDAIMRDSSPLVSLACLYLLALESPLSRQQCDMLLRATADGALDPLITSGLRNPTLVARRCILTSAVSKLGQNSLALKRLSRGIRGWFERWFAMP